MKQDIMMYFCSVLESSTNWSEPKYEETYSIPQPLRVATPALDMEILHVLL